MPETVTPHLSASPVARRLARALGLELAAVAGSGPHDRILKRDVAAASSAPPSRVATAPAPPSSVPTSPAAAPAPTSPAAAPARAAFDLVAEVDVEAALAFTAGSGIATEHLVLKAVAGAGHPVTFVTDSGVRGVPDAAERSLSSLARDPTATRPLDENTIAVATAPGADRYAPALPPGVAAVIAAAGVRDRPIGRDGQLVLAPTVLLTLRCDEGKMSPADGVRLLDAVRTRLESPLTLAL